MPNQIKKIDVLILCGGFGKRLKEISGKTPKPLVKVGKKPFLDILIDLLSRYGVSRILLGVGYNASAFKRYYSFRRDKSPEILLIKEDRPLGTGGALKYARKFIKSNPFVVLNGDSFCTVDLGKLLAFHDKNKSLATLALHRTKDGRDYGKIEIDGNSRILNFCEKNKKAKECLVNSGIYVFDKKIFNFMPDRSAFSLEHDFFPKLVKNKIFGYLYKGFFIDIGTPGRFEKARKYFLKMGLDNGRS